jgi:hypothetical protein
LLSPGSFIQLLRSAFFNRFYESPLQLGNETATITLALIVGLAVAFMGHRFVKALERISYNAVFHQTFTYGRWWQSVLIWALRWTVVADLFVVA